MTPEEFLCARLKAFAPLVALVGTRVFPQVPTQEPTFPLVVYERAGEERQAKLGGAAKTGRVIIDVLTFAETEAGYQAAATQVVSALDGHSDRANKVPGVFHVDSQAGQTEDGYRYMKHSFVVWHSRA